MKRLCIGSIIALCAFFVFSAHEGVAVAEQSDRDRASLHFQRGVALYEASNYEAALEQFQAAYEAQPHPAVLVNIANCYAQTDRPVRAIQTFERYLREHGSRITAVERQAVEQVLEVQRQLVGQLTVRVEPEGAEVTIDGVPIGTSPIEHSETVRAGSHTVEVRVEGLPPLVRQGTIQGGQTATMTVTTLPGSPDVEAPTEPTEPTEPTDPSQGFAGSPDEAIEGGAGGPAMLSVVGSDGALVELDGERVGRVPWEGEVEVGEHYLRLSGEGFLTYETDLDTAPSELTEVSIDLTRGERPRWLPAVEWAMLGLGGGLLVPGIAVVGTSWGRYQDSEAMYTEIDSGRFADRDELDLMWSRYDQMYEEYRGGWSAGWALTGVGIGLVVVSAVILLLDRVGGMFSGRPEAEIDMMPLDADDVDEEREILREDDIVEDEEDIEEEEY